MLVMMKREDGTEAIAVNADRVTWIQPTTEGHSRIYFARDDSVVVDGTVEQISNTLARG
jgi:hypothetical protein